MNEQILKGIEEIAIQGEVACADAHELAARLGVAPIEIGQAVNSATNLRFYRCQLGFFGYGPKEEGKHKIVSRAAHVPAEIGAAIQAQAVDGRIACKAVWDLAVQFKYPRLGMANIVEALDLKVKPCQLGLFSGKGK
jgi:DNA-binding transcriptional regulator YdaS (Cro superfamily)